jgi:hypothetical protein
MKHFFIALLLFVNIGVYAQSSSSFLRAGVGTGATDDSFKGIAFGAEWGKEYRGWEFSGSLTYFDSKMDEDNFRTVSYVEHGSTSHAAIYTLDTDGETQRGMMLRANVGYDVLRFIKGNTRHHLRPFVGIGYASKTTDSGWANENGNEKDIEMRYHHERGIDGAAGMRYEYTIAKNWDLGAYYEIQFNVLSKDLMGLSVRRSF